jgi:hypothetical protein
MYNSWVMEPWPSRWRCDDWPNSLESLWPPFVPEFLIRLDHHNPLSRRWAISSVVHLSENRIRWLLAPSALLPSSFSLWVAFFKRWPRRRDCQLFHSYKYYRNGNETTAKALSSQIYLQLTVWSASSQIPPWVVVRKCLDFSGWHSWIRNRMTLADRSLPARLENTTNFPKHIQLIVLDAFFWSSRQVCASRRCSL